MEQLKILMLGPSATGKTTFMMTTYGMMTTDGIQGFKVKSRNPVQHKQLIKAYRQFETNGEYPEASIQMTDYQYDFSIDGDPILDFELTDIRGESIADLDTTQLREKIEACDVLMLFLNGYDLYMGKDMTNDLSLLYPLINTCLNLEKKSKLVMPTFTQIDRIPGGLTDEVVEKLKEAVQPLIDAKEDNDKFLLQIVPTACTPDCLMDLDFAIVTMIFFGYMVKLVERRKEIERELDEIREMYGSGLIRVLIDWIGLDFKRAKARARAEALQAEIDQFNGMTEYFERLKKFLDDYEIGTSYHIDRPKYSHKDKKSPYEW